MYGTNHASRWKAIDDIGPRSHPRIIKCREIYHRPVRKFTNAPRWNRQATTHEMHRHHARQVKLLQNLSYREGKNKVYRQENLFQQIKEHCQPNCQRQRKRDQMQWVLQAKTARFVYGYYRYLVPLFEK